MKKNRIYGLMEKIGLFKMIKIMRFTIFILFLSLSQTFAVNSYSQQAKLSLDMRNARLEDVLDRIEKNSEFFFMYNKNMINVDRKVDVQVEEKNVNEVLNKIFANTDISYSIKDRQILLINNRMADFGNEFITQQQKSISGKVTDNTGFGLPGVSVVVKGTTTGVITDIEGKYSLPKVPENAILQFSFVGMKSQEIAIGNKTTIDILLIDETIGIEEVVAIGYGTQKRANMTGSVAAIEGEKLSVAPVANISNSIGGKVSGIITRQTSGEPGQDASQLFLRGNTPLVLVDGIERAWDRINMQDIESVTVLKDASAVAPYGLKGANGVILITTKRGKEGKVSLSYSGEFGFQKPTNSPNFLDAAESLRLRNRALIMDGKTDAVVGDDIIGQYEIGTDAYPNTDWVKNYLKSSTTQNHNVSVSGGSDIARAFVSLGYYNQGSMMGEGNGYERYNIRSNLDFKVTKSMDISLDISITKDEKESHRWSAESLMYDVYRLRATEPDVYSNGLPAFQQSIGWSLHEGVHGGGESSYKNDYQNLGLKINQKLSFIEGLSVKANFNYDKQMYDSKSWAEPMISYIYNQSTGEYVENNGWLSSKPSLSQGKREWTYYTSQGYLNYENQFDKHGIQALAVYERRWGSNTELNAGRSQYDISIPELNMGSPNKEYQSNSGSSSESAQDGFIFRLNYNYSQKYLLEFAGRYDRSYRYAPNKRTAFFPSASIGWRLSEESFIKDRFPSIDNLKIRASFGKSGNPVGAEFAYLPKYLIRNTYVWGVVPLQEQGVYEGSEPNTNLTWETVWKTNIGVDLNMWNGLFGMELDVYRDYRKDKILAPDAVVPFEYGIGLSDENAGKEERYGLDLTLTNNTKISSNLSIQNNLVFGFTRNKLIEIREAPGTYNVPKFRRTGNPSSQLRGYKTSGLFKDQQDIDNWAYQGANVLPGDIKYIDLNGDGKINTEDQTIIGKTQIPEIMYGYNALLKYKRLDVKLFLQGTGNSDYYLGSADRGVRYPFDNDKPLADHLKSWTTDNPDPNAPYPRLSTTRRSQNYETSDYWTRNTAYLRLKTVELGYNFAPTLTRKVYMQNVRAHLNFYNVWTIYSQMPKDFDPEIQAYNSYPQQFIISLGLNITL